VNKRILLILPILGLFVAQASQIAAIPPTPPSTPTEIATPSASARKPGTSVMHVASGFYVGVVPWKMYGQKQGSNPEVRGTPMDENYYLRLNSKLSPLFTDPRPKPTTSEKVWGIVGQAVKYSCAAIAAEQALEAVGKKKKTRRAR